MAAKGRTARRLRTRAERDAYVVGYGTASDDVLELACEIAATGVEWRNNESQRLADRATTILTAASVVLGIGAGFVAEGHSPWVAGMVTGALLTYLPLAALMVLALRPRPLPPRIDHAVWSDKATLYRKHRRALAAQARRLDKATRGKERLVQWGVILLSVEVLFLSVGILWGLAG